MARFRTHAIIGVTVSAGAYLVRFSAEKGKNPEAKIDLKELLLYAGVGFLASCLPDLLEPPNSPNHRNFFHSLAFAGMGCLLLQRAKDDAPDEKFWAVLDSVCFVYLSHLGADLSTPRGLPII